jgi:hypothetical protein
MRMQSRRRRSAQFAAASEGALAAAGATGRTWVAETLAFERFRDTLTAIPYSLAMV